MVLCNKYMRRQDINRVVVVTNPVGTRYDAIRPRVDDLQDFFGNQLREVESSPCPSDTTKMLKDQLEGHDVVVTVGGDGTARTAVEALADGLQGVVGVHGEAARRTGTARWVDLAEVPQPDTAEREHAGEEHRADREDDPLGPPCRTSRSFEHESIGGVWVVPRVVEPRLAPLQDAFASRGGQSRPRVVVGGVRSAAGRGALRRAVSSDIVDRLAEHLHGYCFPPWRGPSSQCCRITAAAT